MNPDQLRRAADKITKSFPPPHGGMSIAQYVSCEAVHRLAEALREIAKEDDA